MIVTGLHSNIPGSLEKQWIGKKKHSLAYYCYVNEAKSLQCMIINGICSSASCDQHHLRLGVISPTHTHSAIPFSNELQYLPLQDQPVNYSKCKTSLINF